jgi:hypothetical protein
VHHPPFGINLAIHPSLLVTILAIDPAIKFSSEEQGIQKKFLKIPLRISPPKKKIVKKNKIIHYNKKKKKRKKRKENKKFIVQHNQQ